MAITQAWDRIRTSLWFVPGIMALSALGLAVLTPRLDRAISSDWLTKIPLIFTGRPVGARAVLSTIATSMITIGGVVFSMTIVSLQLASSQFGPRLLRTFLRDRGNQIVLGTFVSTFLYCILVLPRVDATAESVFVPRIAVTMAVVQAILSLGMLVYYIDHIAQSIHADAVIQAVGDELDDVVDQLFPESIGTGIRESDTDKSRADTLTESSGISLDVVSKQAGYVRFINGNALMSVAAENDLLIRIEAEPGVYLFEGDSLAVVHSCAEIPTCIEDHICKAFALGAHRTTLQDISLAFEQLTEMAVRALSPGINDPTTAIHCIDRIGSSLAKLVGRQWPPPLREDDAGNVRIIARPVSFVRLLQVSIEPMSGIVGPHVDVWVRLLEVLRKVYERAIRHDDLQMIQQLGHRICHAANVALPPGQDGSRLEAASTWIAVSAQPISNTSDD